MKGMATALKRVFCRHEWQLVIVGMFDVEYLECVRCGARKWEEEL